MIPSVDFRMIRSAIQLLCLVTSCYLHAADNGTPIHICGIDFIAPTSNDAQITTESDKTERLHRMKLNAKMGNVKFHFAYTIIVFNTLVYETTNEFLFTTDKVNNDNKRDGHIIDTYYREHIQGVQAWITQSSYFDKETKRLVMSTDYDVTHSVYSRAGDQGYLISIFQTFERNNQRAREVSGQLLMDCVGNTKLNGKQLLIEPKFFKNKNAMLDIKGAKRP